MIRCSQPCAARAEPELRYRKLNATVCCLYCRSQVCGLVSRRSAVRHGLPCHEDPDQCGKKKRART